MIDYAVLSLNGALGIGFIFLFLFIFLKIVGDRTDLSRLISEPDSGKASLSRFQLLVFTFVIAGLFLVLSLEAGQFVDVPEGVRWLLGISGGSFVISKGVGIHAKNGGGDGPAKTARNPSKNLPSGEAPSTWTGTAK